MIPNISFGIPFAGKEKLEVKGNVKLNGNIKLNGYNLSSVGEPERDDSPISKKWLKKQLENIPSSKQNNPFT